MITPEIRSLLTRVHKRRSQSHAPPGSAPGTLAVGADAHATMIHLLAYGPDGLVETEITDVEQLPGYTEQWPVVWIDVEGLGDLTTLRRLAELYQLHYLALEDVVNTQQRAKVEEYPGQLFAIAQMVTTSGVELQREQLGLFLGDGWVITIQEHHGDPFEPVRERIREGRTRIRRQRADYLAYAILDAVVDGYFPLVDYYAERLEEIELNVMERSDPQLLATLYAIRRELIRLRRVAWPHRDAVGLLLRNEAGAFSTDTLPYLRDLQDHVLRITDLVEHQREQAKNLMDLYLSAASNRMNEVMQVLTVFAAIFIPLTFIAGLYGMNFDGSVSFWNMPELRLPFGYPAALALMALVAGALVVYFRRKGWLGGRRRQNRPPAP